MSIRNPATGRHEDDLMDLARRNDGQVPIVDLIEHLEEIMGDASTYGSNVANASRSAALLLRTLGLRGKVNLDADTVYASPRT